MPIYEIAWKAFGIASVAAESEAEAMEIVGEGCFNFDDMDFERNDVDGVDTQPA